MIHELKTWPKYYKQVFMLDKEFEIRKNDRDYQINDVLVLREYDPDKNAYTGNVIQKEGKLHFTRSWIWDRGRILRYVNEGALKSIRPFKHLFT